MSSDEPLRLMTFNVQLLPVIAGVTAGTTSVPGSLIGLFPGGDADAVDRATAVADDLLAIPASERPHVIGLNEVFSEDGRDVLIAKLKPVYPHIVESVHEGDLEEDSGLMVFSRIPFGSTPSGAYREELFYKSDADTDSWSSKAAVMVRVDQPQHEMFLVFTHLQAAYLTEDEYRDIRAEQAAEIVEWIDGLLGNDPGKWRNIVVSGDLNVRGDSDAVSDEWFDFFDRPGAFSDHFVDSWTEMRPPGFTEDVDAGLTHRDRATGNRMRLDYLARVEPVDARQVAAHHIRIGHKVTSDHFALEGLFQLRDTNCQPSTATDVLTVPSLTSGGAGVSTSSVRTFHVDINHPGSWHWAWIKTPGTYTFHTSPDLQYDVFAATDISTPLTRIDTLTVAELPPALQAPYERIERTIDPEGSTFVSRHPLLIAIRHRHMKSSKAPFFVLEHFGDSAATAIGLPPHQDVVAPFPPGQRLGDDDIAWFRFLPPLTIVGAARTEKVVLRPPAGRAASLEIKDMAHATVVPQVSGSGTVDSTVTTSGGDDFYATIERDADDAVGHVIRWETPVTYLRLNDGVHVHVVDETGPDWTGADEPELWLGFDDDPVQFAHATWDDADTGEDWPGLTDEIRSAATSRGWTEPSVAFAGSILVSFDEPDWPMAHGSQVEIINGLAPTEPTPRFKTVTLTLYDSVSDGTYTFRCTLSRDP